MFAQALKSFNFTNMFVGKMVEDIPDERLAEQPAPKMNHGAWLLGHLSLTADFIGADLGAEPVAPEGWMERFGPGSVPVSDRSQYPPKEELLTAFAQCQHAVPKILADASPETLNEPPAMEEFVQMGLATRGDLAAALLTGHHGFHVGQLSAWRRAMGFPPAFNV